MERSTKRRLITSALPYVNNIPHLGNLLQVLSADVFARFCRSRGYQTLYVCGTDEYGTATETKAAKENITPRELCDHYHAIHAEIYKWFNISFDCFGRTSTPNQTQIVQHIFNLVDKAGYITEKETSQLYCPNCKRFLADRFVEGTCPHCSSPNARGDQCDACQTLLEPTELINPRCGVCGTTPVVKNTRHLYIDLPKALPILQKWMDKASEEGFWAKNAVQVTRSWIRDGLKERCITRDLKWGIPVPRPGYEDKVFYVWFDAPIGYISISSYARPQDWQSWWHDPENTELYQFIGKDNIPFHTVIFPATLLASGENWTMLHHMSSTEYLNYEGGKFSKSRGVGVFGNDAANTGIPADVWRFWMFYNRPERGDVDFTWKDFQEKVNGELVGNLSNLVNRTLTFAKRFFDGNLGSNVDASVLDQIRSREEVITDLLEHAEERDAFRAVFELSDLGNKLFQESEPWKLKNTDPDMTRKILLTLVYLIRDLAILITPYMPSTGEKLLAMLGSGGGDWNTLGTTDATVSIGEVSYLFTKLENNLIDSLKERFSGSQEEREEKKMDQPVCERFAQKVILKVSEITEVSKHPQGDFLYILKLNTGEQEPRTIVSSIVAYYKPGELLGRKIVLVSNLKPANFRGVKSYGMLLAASDPQAPEHTTCEVLFADDIPAGTNLVPQGLSNPEGPMTYVKPDHFFAMPLYTKDGVLSIDGRPIVSPEGKTVKAKQYLNGNVG